MGERLKRWGAASLRAGLALLLSGAALTAVAAPAAAAGVLSLDPATATGNSFTHSWLVGDVDGTVPLRCQVTGPGIATPTWTTCVGGDSIPLNLTPVSDGSLDGTYTALVEQEAPGTETASAQYVLDTQASTPTLTQTPAVPRGNAPAVSWTWTQPEAGVQCQLVSTPAAAAAALPAPDCSAGAGSYAATLTDDATYTFSVVGLDSLGNRSAAASSSYTYDHTGPTISGLAVTPTVVGHLANPQATWSGTVATDVVTCRVDDQTGTTVLGPAVGCTSPWTVGADTLPAGSYVVVVSAVDDLGNPGAPASAGFQVNLTGPSITGLTVVPGTVSHRSNPRASWSGTVSTDTISCRVDSPAGSVVVAPVGCTSPWTVPAGSLPEGNYLVVVSARDNLGNQGAEASAGFSVDLTGPSTAPVITSTPGATGNTDTPTWTFTVSGGDTAECQFESSSQGVLSSWRPCGTSGGVNTVTTQSLLGRPEVLYTLRIRAVDPVGNPGAEVSSTYLYDVTPPAAPVVSVATSAGQSRTFTATWTGTDSARCTLTSAAGVVALGPDAACSSGASFTVPAVEDDYTLTVRLVDAATNVSSPGRAGYRFDVTAPAPPGVTGPTQGNATSPTFTLTATEPNEVLSCTWTLPASTPGGAPTVVGPTSCPAGAYQPAPPLSGDGTWVLSVVGRDAAGNVSMPTSRSYLLDTGPPPAPPISLGPGTTNPGNDLTPTWLFTAEQGAATECELRTATAVLSPWGACPGGTVTYNLTPASPGTLPDGVYTLRVRATDPFGNVGAPGSFAYTLDTVPPGAPSWVEQPTGPAATAPTWRFSTGLDGAECQLASGGVVVSAWQLCSSPWSPTLGADDDYALSVRSVDSAGNRGPAITSLPFILDTTGPTAPLLVQSPATPAPETMPQLAFSLDDTASGAECRITRGPAVMADWATCTSPWAADLSSRPDATYSLQVRAVDLAGNTSPALEFGYELDSRAPVAVGFITGPAGPARDRAPRFEFPVAAGSTAQCQVSSLSGVMLGWAACSPPCPDAGVDCTATYALDLSGLADGEFRLQVRLVDLAGNPSADKYTTYLLDTTPPGPPAFGLLPESPSAADVVDWRWTGEPGATAQCQLTLGQRLVLGWRTCTSPYRVSLAGRPDGGYQFWVRLTDRAGNRGVPRTAALVRDTTAPVVAFMSTPPGSTSTRLLRWTWTTEPGAQASCLLTRAAVVVADWGPCSGAYTVSLAGEPDGTYRLGVRAVDLAGNMGEVAWDAVTVGVRVPSTPAAGGGGSGAPSVTPPHTGGGLPPVARPPVAKPPVARPPTATPPVKVPTATHPVPSGGSLVPPAPITRLPDLLGRAAVRSLDRPQVPLIVVILIVAFLLIQNRIDRRDPKLAQAPLGVEPMLGFGRLGAAQ